MKFTKPLAVAAAAALLWTAGCSTPEQSSSATTSEAPAAATTEAADTGSSGDTTSGAITITILPKNLGNPYFDTSTKGAKAAAAEIGATAGASTPETTVRRLDAILDCREKLARNVPHLLAVEALFTALL